MTIDITLLPMNRKIKEPLNLIFYYMDILCYLGCIILLFAFASSCSPIAPSIAKTPAGQSSALAPFIQIQTQSGDPAQNLQGTADRYEASVEILEDEALFRGQHIGPGDYMESRETSPNDPEFQRLLQSEGRSTQIQFNPSLKKPNVVAFVISRNGLISEKKRISKAYKKSILNNLKFIFIQKGGRLGFWQMEIKNSTQDPQDQNEQQRLIKDLFGHTAKMIVLSKD